MPWDLYSSRYWYSKGVIIIQNLLVSVLHSLVWCYRFIQDPEVKILKVEARVCEVSIYQPRGYDEVRSVSTTQRGTRPLVVCLDAVLINYFCCHILLYVWASLLLWTCRDCVMFLLVPRVLHISPVKNINNDMFFWRNKKWSRQHDKCNIYELVIWKRLVMLWYKRKSSIYRHVPCRGKRKKEDKKHYWICVSRSQTPSRALCQMYDSCQWSHSFFNCF